MTDNTDALIEQQRTRIAELEAERDDLLLMRDGLIDILRRVNPFAKPRGRSSR